MEKDTPTTVYLPSFSWKNPEEYRIKYAISSLERPFPDQVEESIRFLKRAGAAVLPCMQEAMEERQFEKSQLWEDVPKVFANIGDPAIPVLVEYLAREDSYFHDMADNALEMIGKRAVPALCMAIRHPDPKVRIRILSLLETFRHPGALPVLITALSDENDMVASYAADAIVAIKPSCYNQILPLLKSDDVGLVCTVIDLLPALNRKKGIAAIMPCFADERDKVRDAAGDTLFNLEPPPVAEMIPYLSSDTPTIVVGALNLLANEGTTTDITAVEKLLTHPDEELRDIATWCLETIRERSEAKPKETNPE
ncbi:MAG: hypothetical protein STSR0009_03940 [Methanoregula sp.]